MEETEPSGLPDKPRIDCSGDPPFLRRRRHVLFGRAARRHWRHFEEVPPQAQFEAEPPSDDPVFDRFHSLEVANKFRQEAQAVQYQDNGYLRENAIELLGLGLEQGSSLCKRLFEVAQAQHIKEVKRRPKLLTCYELLALHSVLRAGQDEELLELLYCLFDADEDDRLNVADLTTAIDVFLGLQEAADELEEQDRLEFSKIDIRERHAEAKRLAELAVQKYGSTVIESDLDEEEQQGQVQEEQQKLVDHTTIEDEDPFLFGSKRPMPQDDRVQDVALDTTQAEKEPSDGDERQPLKPKHDDDSDDDDEVPKDAAKAKATPKKAPRKIGFCMGKMPSEPGSDGESLLETPPPKAKAKPKPKPTPASAKKGGSSWICGGNNRSGRRKGPPALTYDQWRKWLAASELLPPGFAGLELPRAEVDDTGELPEAPADMGARVSGASVTPAVNATASMSPTVVDEDDEW